ncbi:MAG: NUDIX domain-containing protein [Saprospiraceae bacterium]|nr:NUDIX domain-containing protein [Saprospiraceae bacterium]
MTPGIKRVAVFCIIRSGDKFLLLKRAKEPNKGKFVPVGGKIDPFETPYEAVIRETYEETGIRLTSAKFCGILSDTSPVNYNWVSFIYTAEIDFIPAPICDEGELYWISESELRTLDTPSTDRYIYKYVAAERHFVFSAEYDADLNMTQMKDELSGFVT